MVGDISNPPKSFTEYEAGDLRRDVTILKAGDKFTFNGKDRIYASSNSLTGYQFNKYMDAFKYPLNSGHVSANGDYPCTILPYRLCVMQK